MAITRQDYGNRVIHPSNETLRRVDSANAPYSAQATGIDKHLEKKIEITPTGLASLEGGERVLIGNREGVVDNIVLGGVAPNQTLTSLDVQFEKDGTTTVKTYTAEGLINEGIIFLSDPQRP